MFVFSYAVIYMLKLINSIHVENSELTLGRTGSLLDL